MLLLRTSFFALDSVAEKAGARVTSFGEEVAVCIAERGEEGRDCDAIFSWFSYLV